ncbi:hypothetical protein MZM54_22790 [[Brevibacterium] frigoritolerans]|nr:hypothetical protein [Peribacillus frigoritolerans]
MIDYPEQFNVSALIYCDFWVLFTTDRAALPGKIHKVLRPNGCLIFDVSTPELHAGQEEYKNGGYEEAGFGVQSLTFALILCTVTTKKTCSYCNI